MRSESTARRHGGLHRYPATIQHRASLQEPFKHVNIGGVEASRTPLRLHTTLGSCVSVCFYDPKTRIGGMNHILVPSSLSDCNCAARCGVQAMELLINAMMKLGADRGKFVAKAFGGGNVLPVFRVPTIGELNAKFVREFLKTEGIPLVAERLGGELAVKLNFFTETGKAVVSTVNGSRLPSIVREETRYYNSAPVDRFTEEEPIIF